MPFPGNCPERFPARIAVTTYFGLAQDEFAAILEDQRGVLHAGEAETSMMLALAERSRQGRCAAGRLRPAGAGCGIGARRADVSLA